MKIFRWMILIAFISIAPAVPAKQSIVIICQKSYYTPSTIHLKKGEPVELVFKSKDVTHGVAIDAFHVAVEVSPGPATSVQITPDQAGTFDFHCVVRCGKGHANMHGTIIVE